MLFPMTDDNRKGTASVTIKGTPGKTKTLSQTRPDKTPDCELVHLILLRGGIKRPCDGYLQRAIHKEQM